MCKKFHDKNISPVGWHVGSYLIRFIELENKESYELEERFLSWENTIVVKAPNMDEAYDKVVDVAKSDTKPYNGGSDGILVQWMFEGVTELLPIYEEIKDGSEIMWAEYKPKKLKNLRNMVKSRNALYQ